MDKQLNHRSTIKDARPSDSGHHIPTESLDDIMQNFFGNNWNQPYSANPARTELLGTETDNETNHGAYGKRLTIEQARNRKRRLKQALGWFVAAITVGAGSYFVGQKYAEHPKVSEAACTGAAEKTIWDTATKINPNGKTGEDVYKILNTDGNEDIDLGNIRKGDEISLSYEQCENAIENGVYVEEIVPSRPLDYEY